MRKQLSKSGNMATKLSLRCYRKKRIEFNLIMSWGSDFFHMLTANVNDFLFSFQLWSDTTIIHCSPFSLNVYPILYTHFKNQ